MRVLAALPASGTMHSRWHSAAALLIGLALWQFNNAYLGIWHDARIYMLAAVRWLSPESYQRDLWFMFGSQDEFSLFSPFMAMFIKLLDISRAAATMAWLGGVAWVCAAFAVARYSGMERTRWVAAFVVLCGMPLNYGASLPMFVAESFATARPLAMALALGGIALAVHERHVLSIVAILAGTALHPLMGIWGLLAVAALRMPDRALLAAVAVGFAGGAFIALNPPEWAVLQPMSGDWGDIVLAQPMVTLRPWPDVRADATLWSIAALLWGGQMGVSRLRRTYQVAALLGSLGLWAAMITSYYAPIHAFLQLQSWRAIWLATVFGAVAAMDVGGLLLRGGSLGKSLLALAMATFLMREWGGGLTLAMAFFVHGCWPSVPARLARANAGSVARLSWGCAISVLLIRLPVMLADVSIEADSPLWGENGPWALMGSGVLPMVRYTVTPLVSALLLIIVRAPIALLAGIVLAGATLCRWDQRDSHVRYVESRYHLGGNRAAFDGAVRPGNVVYWSGEPLRVWFELGTASYASLVQGIGMIFSQGRSIELRRRFDLLALKESIPDGSGRLLPDRVARARLMLSLQLVNRAGLGFIGYEPLSLTESGLRRLCSDDGLDFVIDSAAIGGLWSAEHVDTIGSRHARYYLYDCRRLRTH